MLVRKISTLLWITVIMVTTGVYSRVWDNKTKEYVKHITQDSVPSKNIESCNSYRVVSEFLLVFWTH